MTRVNPALTSSPGEIRRAAREAGVAVRPAPRPRAVVRPRPVDDPLAPYLDKASGVLKRFRDGRVWARPGAILSYAAITPLALVIGVFGVVNKGPDTASATAAPIANVLSQISPARLTPADPDHTPLRIYGTSTGMIGWDLAKAGVPTNRIDEYLDILGPYVGAESIAPGDKFDIELDRTRWPDGESNVGDIVYAGLYQTHGQQLHISQWTKGGKLRWYDAARAAGDHDDLQRPVPGRVSSSFGMRFHPLLGFTRMHRGIDFAAGLGDPILATQTGWVAHAGWEGSFGNQVELTHGGGFSTTYSHMEKVGVHAGQLVEKGSVIGWVGATGLATGPHLHYELHKNGVAIDPSSVRFTVGPELKGRDLEGYERRLRALLAVKADAAAKA